MQAWVKTEIICNFISGWNIFVFFLKSYSDFEAFKKHFQLYYVKTNLNYRKINWTTVEKLKSKVNDIDTSTVPN